MSPFGFWGHARTLADDLRERARPASSKLHPHFHSHGGLRHVHRHRHTDKDYEHAHSNRTDT